MTNTDNDAIARAEADLLEYERKINALMTEEARLDAQRRQLEHERDRVRAFVEMYQHYTGDGTPQTGKESEAKPAKPTTTTTRTKRGRMRVRLDRKPDGIPPMTEMITTAIKTGIERGLKGLEPAQMTNFIRNQWWPNVKSESVGPIAWRMAQNGQLKKEGSTYKLP
jgi:hypothetical protein